MQEWVQELHQSELIYLYAPGNNKKTLFGVNSSPFVASDPSALKMRPKEAEELAQSLKEKVRSVPFSIGRPTLLEIKRAHLWLSSISFSEASMEALHEALQPRIPEKPAVKEKEKEKEKAQEIKEEDAKDLILEAAQGGNLPHLEHLIDSEYERPIPTSDNLLYTPLFIAVQRQDLAMVRFLVQRAGIDIPNPNPNPPRKDPHFDLEVDFVVPQHQFRTALHEACALENIFLIEVLLLAKANPSLKDFFQKTPYEVAKEKETKLFLRKFAAKHLGISLSL
jgi:hypothetical protein